MDSSLVSDKTESVDSPCTGHTEEKAFTNQDSMREDATTIQVRHSKARDTSPRNHLDTDDVDTDSVSRHDSKAKYETVFGNSPISRVSKTKTIVTANKVHSPFQDRTESAKHRPDKLKPVEMKYSTKTVKKTSKVSPGSVLTSRPQAKTPIAPALKDSPERQEKLVKRNIPKAEAKPGTVQSHAESMIGRPKRRSRNDDKTSRPASATAGSSAYIDSIHKRRPYTSLPMPLSSAKKKTSTSNEDGPSVQKTETSTSLFKQNERKTGVPLTKKSVRPNSTPATKPTPRKGDIYEQSRHLKSKLLASDSKHIDTGGNPLYEVKDGSSQSGSVRSEGKRVSNIDKLVKPKRDTSIRQAQTNRKQGNLKEATKEETFINRPMSVTHMLPSETEDSPDQMTLEQLRPQDQRIAIPKDRFPCVPPTVNKTIISNKILTENVKLDGGRNEVHAQTVKLTGKVKLESTGLKHFQEQTEERLTKDEDIFVETSSYHRAKQCLDTYQHVTILGQAGSGKTSIGLQLLRCYREKCTPLIVDSAQDLKLFRNPNSSTLVLANDIFGKTTFSQEKLQDWFQIFESLQESFKSGKLKLIFTSRKYIYLDAQYSLITYRDSIFNDNTLVDLSGDACLMPSEKTRILNMFANRENITLGKEDTDAIVSMECIYGFPHACFLFSQLREWHDKPVEFFKRPRAVLIESIQNIALHDENKFALLLLVLLADGPLRLATLAKETHLLEKVKDMIPGSNTGNFVRRRHQIASPLIGSYLTTTRDTLSFRHPTVEDTVAYVTGTIVDPMFLIEYSSMRVLYERVRIHISRGQGSTKPTHGDTQWFHVVMSDDYHDDLIARFVSEIETETFPLVCLHQACSDQNFVTKLFAVLNALDKSNKEKLFHKTDVKHGQTFLEWSVMNSSEALCDKLLEESVFSILEKNNAMVTCCVTGNSRALDKLIKSLHPLGRRLLTKMRVRKLDIMVIKDTEKISIKKGPVNRYSLLHVACNYGQQEVVAVLIKSGFSVNGDGEYESPLHSCCRKGHVGVLSYLVAQRANLEEKHSFWEETPLHICSRLGHIAAVKKCVELGANIEAKDIDDNTSLLSVCKQGDEHIVQYLIEQGAEKEVRDCYGSTPLMQACIHGHYNVVKTLLKHKCSMEAKNSKGITPLMEACKQGHTLIADDLIRNGANIEDTDGLVLHYACYGGCLNVIKHLQSKHLLDKVEIISLLQTVSFKAGDNRDESKLTIAKLFIDMGANVNNVDEQLMTPLMVAAESGYEKLAVLFIENGAKVFVKDINGQTLFHKAAKGDSFSLLSRLFSMNISADLRHFLSDDGLEIESISKSLKPDETNEKGTSIQADKFLVASDPDGNNDTPLHIAAMFGGSDCVKTFLKNGADINAINVHKQTALHLAAQRQNPSLIEALLELGSNVNLQDMNMKTPLHLAAKLGTLDTVKLLLEFKGSVNALDHRKRTPLHKALQYRKNEIAMLLLLNGADFNIGDNINQTPLHVAAESGNTEALEKMLEMKALVSVKDVSGQSPLHLAVLHRPTPDCVEILVNSDANVNAKDITGMTPLHYAGMFGKHDSVQVLLEHKAEIDAMDNNQQTPLHLAVQDESNLYTAYVLLLNNAKVNAVDKSGQSPLHVAAARCFTAETVQVLLENDADADIADENKQTPLHVAANKADVRVIQVLLNSKADVNITDCKLQTPLHISVVREPDTVTNLLQKDSNITGVSRPPVQYIRDIIQVFLNNGANVNAVDNQHRTSLHLAILKCRPEIVTMLLECNADINIDDDKKRTALHLAVISQRPDVVQLIVDQNIDVNAVDDVGDTPLHLAATRWPVSIIQLLLDSGAEVNSNNIEGRTPFHFAALASNFHGTQALLDKQANVNSKDEKGMTPLHLAVMSRTSAFVGMLLNNGAEVNAADAYQQTPLHLAAGKGYVQNVELLLNKQADVNARDHKSQSPLHFAAKGKIEWSRVMIDTINRDLGKDAVNKMSKLAKSRLFQHADTCQLLLTFKADVNAHDERNRTPLHLAAGTDHVDVVKVLLDNGADTDSVDDVPNTPLQIAQQCQCDNVVDLLMGKPQSDVASSGPILALPP